MPFSSRLPLWSIGGSGGGMMADAEEATAGPGAVVGVGRRPYENSWNRERRKRRMYV